MQEVSEEQGITAGGCAIMRLKDALNLLRRLPDKLVGDRKIIVISDQQVSNFPITAKFQWAAILFTAGFITWASYSTGTYIAYQSVLDKKERQLNMTSEENRRIEEQYSLLKRDLLKINEEKEELSDYKEFILSQYDTPEVPVTIGDMPSAKIDEENDQSMLDRIAYLENKLEESHKKKQHLLQAIRSTTKGKISELEAVINTTKLKLGELKELAPEKPAKEKEEARAKSEDQKESYRQQGGPLVPFDNDLLEGEELNVMKEVEYLTELNAMIEALPLDFPIRKGRITSHFGRRKDPITKRWAFHGGMDFAGKLGAEIVAPAPGKVVYAGRKGSYGNFIEIDHGYGVTSRYGHLRKIKVKKGQWVDKNVTIGLQGTTGRSTGEHLHYEIRFRGRPLNPRSFLNAGKKLKTDVL